MSFINLVIALIVVGVGTVSDLLMGISPWHPASNILNVVVVAVCVWVLQAVGIWGNLTSYRLT